MKTNHQRSFKGKRHADKSMQGWSARIPGIGSFAASIGNDFTNGNRGMARAVRGAKKFVRSRIRSTARKHIEDQLND